MAACEDCWDRAYTIARLTGRHQAEVYRELIAASPKSHDQSEVTERPVIRAGRVEARHPGQQFIICEIREIP